MRLIPDSWGSTFVEAGGNDCNLPAGGSDGGQFGRNDDPRCGSAGRDAGGVPASPGSVPVPPGMVRGYHYTDAKNIDSIFTHGVQRKHARGASYGEPAVVWLSTAKPSDRDKHYIEVHVHPEEIGIGAPRGTSQASLDEFNAGSRVFAMKGDVPPDRIVTQGAPWMAKYHAVAGSDTFRQMVLAGKMDNAPAYARIAPAIKRRFGRTTRESQADIVTRFGIEPSTLDFSHPGGQVKCVGYSPRTRKWYGWSHRAVAGFGVGDTVPKHQFPQQREALRGEGYPGKTGDRITTSAMAKRVAMAFACEVS